MSDPIWLSLIWGGWAVGMVMGKAIADARWRDAADHPMAVHSKGKLFDVIAAGDAEKASDVLAANRSNLRKPA